MVLENLFDWIFSPIMRWGDGWAVIIVSLIITLITTFFYKMFTDQDLMKALKKELKDLQKEMKDLKEDPKKFMEVQKKAMQKNMEYMKHSMKATLYTFIPIIIIFGWMQGHLGYDPIEPNEAFKVSVLMQEGLPGEITLSSVPELNIDQATKAASSTVTWELRGTEGEYKLFVTYGENQYEHDLIITTEHIYKSPVKKLKGAIKSITVEMAPIKPFGSFGILGWHPGWLGAYILLSIVFSLGARKVFKVS